jgi:hypothetical protein
MKMIENRLRKIIKEAVMNEILLQNYEGGASMSEANRLRHGMTEALRTYLTGEGGIPQSMIGEIHIELDEHISDMVDIIMQYKDSL